jgi:excisionase family DNA binding protein
MFFGFKSDLLDLAEAAEYLKISVRKLKDICRDGRITHDRLDYRTYRFSREKLDAYLAQYRMHAR